MGGNSYWVNRENEALKNRITDEKAYKERVEEIYSNMLDSTEKEINAFFGKYAKSENITLAEAKARVSSLDVKAFERKAKRYVEDREFSTQANEELRLYNATMRINRLEMLKANIGLELIAGHEELNRFMGDILKGRTEDELKRQAGILGKTIKNNAQTVDAIVNSSFHNATFSDRIWLYQDLLKANLDKQLQQGLIAGKSPKALARDLKNTFEVSTFNAERLMTTELARVQTEAQKQSFERNGFEEYTFLANSGCCGDCQAHNGKHFKVKDMMPGDNAPPVHPLCRCSTAAYSDRKEYDEWLKFLENGGTTAEFEQMKAIRNNADRQAQIRARREAYKQREAKQSTPDFASMDKKQLENWAAEHLKTPFENIKGVNVDFLREAVKVVNQFEHKTNGSIDGLKISFGTVGRGRYAAYDFKTKTLHLKKAGNLEAFSESQKKENTRARIKLKRDYHATETYSGTVWHELGHAIDHDTGNNLSKALSATKELDSKSVKISVYAGSSPALNAPKRSEAWAENFAAYMEGGAKAREVPPEIVEMIEDYFNKKRVDAK